MSFLGLDPTQELDLYDQAARNPNNSNTVSPGTFTGIGTGVVNGFMRGGAEVASLGSLALSTLPILYDRLHGGTEFEDQWFKAHDELFGNAVDYWMPQPHTVGAAGNILGGLAGIGLPLAAGLGNPSVLVASSEMQAAKDLSDQGVDPATAVTGGIITGAATAAGVHLPTAVGANLLKNLAVGVTGNIALGAASRGATGELLQQRGYEGIASQYKTLDTQAMIIDGVLGLAFGGLGHIAQRGEVKPSDIDAALTANNAQHLEVDTLPGLPTDLATRQAHIDAQVKATEDLIAGRPVDVAEQTQQMHFEDNPHADAIREDIGQAIKNSEAGQALAQAEKLNEPIDHTIGRMHEEDLAKLEPEQADKLRQLYQEASDRKSGFDSTLKYIADTIGAKYEPIGLKGSPRAVEKTLNDNGGDASKIKDLLRGTLEIDSVSKAMQAIEAIKQHFNVLPTGARNYLDTEVNPTDGYRDAKFNVDMNGHIAEVQVNIPELMAVKKAFHKQYEDRSTIERQIKPGGAAAPEQAAEIARLNAEMKAAYDPVWTALTKDLNADSEIAAPLRRAESGGNGRGEDLSQAAQYPAPGTLPKVTGVPSTSKNSTLGGNFTGEPPFAESIARGEGHSQENTRVNTQSIDSAVAEQVLRERPDLQITLENGETVSAADAYAEADAQIQQAQRESSVFDAAVQCFLRG